MKSTAFSFNSVLEPTQPFLSLWPHRFDFIWAEHPAPGQKPDWQTESRHPLSDRLMLQGAYLYGVRFGPTTNYIMLDIDQGSPYHPARDPLALPRLRAALEDLGLVEGILCTSSPSQGLHLYFPFEETQKSWRLALAVTTCLENQGFKFAPGQLELFPHLRHYTPGGEHTLYHGHRLPLQMGSYLLNSQLEAIHTSPSRFVAMWANAKARNSLTHELVTRAIKTGQRRHYRITGKAEKFLNDLNADIEPGWTGPGLTNKLLGRITLRSYIFGHILYAPAPLQGEALVQDVVRIAQALPGLHDWSNHVHELEAKARAWARAIERSHYYPYGLDKLPGPSPDQRTAKWAEQRQASRDKICQAIATLLNEGALPVTATGRFSLLTSRFQLGGTTLYKHKDLWHPDHLQESAPDEPPQTPPALNGSPCKGRVGNAPLHEQSPSLLGAEPGNHLPDQDLSPGPADPATPEGSKAENQLSLFDLGAVLTAAKGQQQRAAASAAYRRNVHSEAQRAEAQARLLGQIRDYLGSGDPVLMGEALSWLAAHPEYRDQVL